MRKLFLLIPVALAVIFNISTTYAQSSDEALAIIVPGGGTYSRSIGTNSAEAQAFSIKAFAWLGDSIFRNR